MTSAGSMSGVNCKRENLTLRQFASDLTDSVFASPGTPSSNTCPLASKPMTSRSTRYVWPTITLPNALNSGRTTAPASCTASLIALIPVFIGPETLLFDGQENQKMRSTKRLGDLAGSYLARFPQQGVAADGSRRILPAPRLAPTALGGY